MSRDTDRDWAKVAEENPYWAVVSVERFLGKEISETEREVFFRSGEQTVGHIFAVIGTHFIPNFAPARSLEFGCGVGRLLVPIARRSGEAFGVDVAPNMFELSRRYLRAANIENARLILADDPVMQGEAVFDFINTLYVLQHIPTERGYRILLDLLRLLKPGGIAALHFAYARGEKQSRRAAATYVRRDGATVVREDPFEPDVPEGTILMFDYDLNHIMVLLAEAGIAPVIVYPDGEHHGHMYVSLYMRKPQ